MGGLDRGMKEEAWQTSGYRVLTRPIWRFSVIVFSCGKNKGEEDEEGAPWELREQKLRCRSCPGSRFAAQVEFLCVFEHPHARNYEIALIIYKLRLMGESHCA